MVTPIIATIKNIIDDKKDKIGNASKFIQNNPVQYKSSEKEEDSIDIAGTDDTLDHLYLGKSTENIDKNRKF
jgi:hypothetical protein